MRYSNKVNLSFFLLMGGCLFNPLKVESKTITSEVTPSIENKDFSNLPLLDRRIILSSEMSDKNISDYSEIKNEFATSILNDGLLSVVRKDVGQTFYVVDSYE